jgi:hypothetical protein
VCKQEQIVQLFHFTSIANADSIMAEGAIRPSDNPRDGLSLDWPHGCVWFSRIPFPTWWVHPDMYRRCLVVVLPASDKRLMSVEQWMHQHLAPERIEEGTANLDEMDAKTDGNWRSGWVYFGTVPANRIKGVVVIRPIDADGVEITEGEIPMLPPSAKIINAAGNRVQ